MEDQTPYTTALQPVIDTAALANIVNQAPDILAENKNSHDKAIDYGNKLLQQSEQGMNDHLDQVMSKYLDKLRLTHKTCNERRKPFTQLMTEVTKRFTTIEADIDPAGKGNIFQQVQNKRNEYASVKIAEQKKREREAQAMLEKEKERISIESFAETTLRQAVAKYTAEFKAKMVNILENMTLETIDRGDEQFAGIEKINPSLLIMPPAPNCIYTSKGEADAITESIRTNPQLVAELSEQYRAEVVLLRKELIDKLPSKKAELEAIANSSAAEAERLRVEAEMRKKADQARMQADADAKVKAEAEASKAKEEAAKLDATVNTQAELFTEAPKVKEGCEIILKNTAAYQLIFMFWWEREGKSLPEDKIEKMTMARMKAFCEKQAVATGEEIKSNLIEYRITYKAK